MQDDDQENGLTLADIKHNFKVKLIAGIAIAIILTAIVLDTLEFIEKWW